nr:MULTISPECIES: amidase family protein [unclassified Rhizobium]
MAYRTRIATCGLRSCGRAAVPFSATALAAALIFSNAYADQASPAASTATIVSKGVTDPSGLVGVDAAKLQKALSAGQITSVKLVQAYLDRIKAYDAPHEGIPGLRAVIDLNKDALADAKALDEERAAGKIRGPLHGIPILVKEVINIKGMYTPVREESFKDLMNPIIAPSDAFTIKKLRDAGAIILAHTRNGEGTNNPFDQSKHPGGSSAGNGAGIAAGYAPLGLGEDTGGSTRIPGAWTSTVGFRPSTGMVSMDGSWAYSYWSDTLGPQALTVSDVATMMDVIAGYDPTYPSSVKFDLPKTFAAKLDKDYLKGKTIGILEPARRASEQNVVAAFDEAVKKFEEAGAKVVSMDVDISPDPKTAEKDGTQALLEAPGGGLAGWVFPTAEGAADRFFASLDADDSDVAKLAEPTDKLTQHDLDVAAKQPLTPADDEALGKDLENNRKSLRNWYGKIVEKYGVDFVVYPTMRTLPPAAALPKGTFKPQNTQIAPFLGYPAISIPGGYVDDLPFGVEIMGVKAGDDADVLGAGFAFEQASNFRRAPASTPALKGEMDLIK